LGDDPGSAAPEALGADIAGFGGIYQRLGVGIIGGVGMAMMAEMAAMLVVINGAAEVDFVVGLFFWRLGIFNIQHRTSNSQ
jgi:hypothetical protein